MKHILYTSQDGLSSITVCGQGNHTKSKHCPDYGQRVKSKTPCDLCIKDGVKFCECGGVANNTLLLYKQPSKIVCGVCGENAPLGSRLIPLESYRHAGKTKYRTKQIIEQSIAATEEEGVECGDEE